MGRTVKTTKKSTAKPSNKVARVYKDKNSKIKKELSLSTPKNRSRLA